MSYTFQFFAPVLPGDRCLFYAGFPASASQLAGETDPMATVTLGSDLTATLSRTSGESEVALVLSRGGVYGRSNSLPLSGFSTTAPNKIYVTTLSHEITAAEIAGYVPATPFTTDNITVTSAKVKLTPPNLVISGAATSDGWWFFDFTLTYEYICRLAPVTTPIWFMDAHTEYLSIAEVDFSLSGKNLLQDFFLLFGKGTIRSRLEQELADQLNAEVRDQLSALDDPAATLSNVTITASAITADITLVSTDSLCPLAMSSAPASRLRARPRAQVDRLRMIRDHVLAPEPRGQAYLDVFTRHRTELWRLVLTDPAAAATLSRAVDLAAGELGRAGVGQLSAGQETVTAAVAALDALAAHASDGLRQDLASLRTRLAGRNAVTTADLLG